MVGDNPATQYSTEIGKKRGRPKGSKNRNKGESQKMSKNQQKTNEIGRAVEIQSLMNIQPKESLREAEDSPNHTEKEAENECESQTEETVEFNTPNSDSNDYSIEFCKAVLVWWKDEGRQAMNTCKNNNQKSNVWRRGASDIGNELGQTISGERVKREFHTLKRSYKTAIRQQMTSGNPPSEFELMEECEVAFANDHDIKPPQVIGGSNETPDNGHNRRKRRAERDPGIEDREMERDRKREDFRNNLLAAINKLVDKF